MRYKENLILGMAVLIATVMVVSSLSVGLFTGSAQNSSAPNASSSGSSNTYLVTVSTGNTSYNYYEEVQNNRVVKTWPASAPSASAPPSAASNAVSFHSSTDLGSYSGASSFSAEFPDGTVFIVSSNASIVFYGHDSTLNATLYAEVGGGRDYYSGYWYVSSTSPFSGSNDYTQLSQISTDGSGNILSNGSISVTFSNSSIWYNALYSTYYFWISNSSTNPGGNINSYTSDGAVLSVTDPPALSFNQPTPSSASFDSGNSVDFSTPSTKYWFITRNSLGSVQWDSSANWYYVGHARSYTFDLLNTNSTPAIWYLTVCNQNSFSSGPAAGEYSTVTIGTDPTVSIPTTVGPYPYDVGQTSSGLVASVSYMGYSTGLPYYNDNTKNIYVNWFSASSSGLTYAADSGSMTDLTTYGLVFTPLTTATQEGTTYYYAVVFDDNAAPGYTSTSSAVEVTVSADPTVSVTASASSGNPYQYDAGQTASAISGAASVTYTGSSSNYGTNFADNTKHIYVEWYSSPSSTIDYPNGNTGLFGTTFTPPMPAAGSPASTTYYFAVVFDSNVGSALPGGYYSDSSDYIEVVVIADPTVSVSTTPGPYTYDAGQTTPAVTALSAAITYSGTGTTTVNWYLSSSSTTPTISGSSMATGTTSPVTFTPPVTTSGTFYYFAQVTDSLVPGYTHDSHLVEVVVNADPTVSVTSTTVNYDVGQSSSTTADAASVTYAGASTHATDYSDHTLSVYVEWYSSSTNDFSSATATGDYGTTLPAPSTTSASTTYFWAVVFDTSVSSYASSSSGYIEVVVNADPTVSIAPTGPLSYSVGATPSTLAATVTYYGSNTVNTEWYSNSVSSTTGGTDTGISGLYYTPSTSSGGTTYYFAVVTDDGVPSYTSYSNIVEVDVMAVGLHPAPPSAPPGAKLQTNIVAKITNGEVFGYQGYWAMDNYNLHMQVWKCRGNGTYYATIQVEGKATTYPGVNAPGTSGFEGAQGTASMHGWVSYWITGSLVSDPTYGEISLRTNGNVGTFDYGGSVDNLAGTGSNTAPPNAIDWPSVYLTITTTHVGSYYYFYEYRGQMWTYASNVPADTSGNIVIV